jgi:hypothetical protein
MTRHHNGMYPEDIIRTPKPNCTPAAPPNLGAERPRFDYIEEKLNLLVGDLQDVRTRAIAVGERLGAHQPPETSSDAKVTPIGMSVAARLEQSLEFAQHNISDIRFALDRLERL